MSIKVGDLVRIDHNDEIMELQLQEESGKDCVMVDSPVGQALIGRDIGDRFSVSTPNGVTPIKILEVNTGDALPF